MTGTTGSGGTSASTSTSVTTSGSGGTGGTSFCAGATDADLGSIYDGDLMVTGQEDLYRFTGKKGQVIMIDIDAQVLDQAEFDPTYIDSVVTLFDANGVQLAQNNDPIEYSTGDSRLYTILPADGEYCARVAECWTVIANPGQSCDGTKDKVFTEYHVYFEEQVDDVGDAHTAEVESGDDAASAIPIGYEKDSSMTYSTSIWGTFRDQDDVDVFSFTMPTDLTPPPPANARTEGRFYIMSSGPKQSGSTSPTGTVTIVDAAAGNAVLALVDATKNPRLEARLELGKPYLLFVTRPKGASATNDFYFLRHRPGWSNPLELEKGGGMNDTPATAEPLTLSANDAYIEGDLLPAGDVDFFVATVPSGVTNVSGSCSGQRYGSGVRGLKVSLLASDGTPLSATASDTEAETHFTSIPDQPLNGAKSVILKVEAASQDPTVTSAFYQCGVHFKP